MSERVPDLQQWERGPKIVAIGGGTGLSTMLRGLKKYTKNLTAIVTVADDGAGLSPDFSDKDRLGLRIAETTVRTKLKGDFHVHSDQGGTRISFDMKNEIL